MEFTNYKDNFEKKDSIDTETQESLDDLYQSWIENFQSEHDRQRIPSNSSSIDKVDPVQSPQLSPQSELVRREFELLGTTSPPKQTTPSTRSFMIDGMVAKLPQPSRIRSPSSSNISTQPRSTPVAHNTPRSNSYPRGGVDLRSVRETQKNEMFSSKKHLDIHTTKVNLMDFGISIKNVEEYLTNTAMYLFSQMDATAGAVFILKTANGTREWTQLAAYPSQEIFQAKMPTGSYVQLLEQAASEKRCFCLHGEVRKSGQLSYMFLPVIAPSFSGGVSAVYVCGVSIAHDVEVNEHLVFLDHARKPIAHSLDSFHSENHNNSLIEDLGAAALENEHLKRRNQFNRALIGVISAIDTGEFLGKSITIICTNTRGTISYASPKVEEMVGYTPSELVGIASILHFFKPQEIAARKQQLEMETRRAVSPGFPVIVARTLLLGGKEDTQIWSWKKRDGSSLLVSVGIRPMYDEKSTFGFVAIVQYCTDSHI